jgi:carbonic anhydrase
MIPAQEALARLQAGNARFTANLRSSDEIVARSRLELTIVQEPFAIILGCSDARVPAELIFDQGLGDLFVIRVAGNIVAPSQVGSVEFAAERFHTRLVVVLGHSQCGRRSRGCCAPIWRAIQRRSRAKLHGRTSRRRSTT